MTKKKKFWLWVLAVVVAISFAFGGFFVGRAIYSDKELRRVKFILDTYHEYYYEESDEYLSDLTKGLMDKNSNFFTKKEYEEYYSSNTGSRENMGFAINVDTLEIVKVSYNSPADRAGMTTGGKVIKVNGVSVENVDEFDLNKTSGENTFTVLYADGGKDFKIKAEEYTETFVKFYDGEKEYSFKGEKNIELKEENSSFSVPEGYSYLIYRTFTGCDINSDGWKSKLSSSVGQFVKALEIYKNGNNKKLIIDLRDNGGGYVEAMRYLVSYFVEGENGDTPVIQKNVYKKKTEEIKSYDLKSQDYDYESIVILANENTASASEAFIGALLDYDSTNRVKVVVEKNESRGDYSTYGKGTMQSTYFSSSGDVVKLTVAKIYWRSEICIDGVGISANVSDKVLEAKDSNNQPIDALLYVNNNF